MTLACQTKYPEDVRLVDSDTSFECSKQTKKTIDQIGPILASCSNNMKQLGLVLKMFAAEDPESSYPGGWAMTIPEYLADTKVLTCPGLDEADNPGRTVSYELLFPATSETRLIEIVRELGMDNGMKNVMLSAIPVAIETHECAGSGMNHVLFADGHVEALDSEAWIERVQPYTVYADAS
tara:strand:- start:957 stop:1496 length:540 start_codon:yes stop_codon:yes gene_type:complete